MQSRKTPVEKVVRRGQLINGLVYLIIMGFWTISCLVLVQLKQASILSVSLVLVAGMVIGWIAWAWMVPQWRSWARKQIDPSQNGSLESMAVQTGLQWPRDHIFSRTEIKSRQQKLEDVEFAVSEIEEILQKYFSSTRLDNFKKRDINTKVIEEIDILIKGLRHRIDTNGQALHFDSDVKMINSFIKRLEAANHARMEIGDWYGPTSILIKKLRYARQTLCAIK